MNEHDHAIAPVGIPNVSLLAKKPPHLISLNNGKKTQFFLSLDKPELLQDFIQVKGFYFEATLSEEDINKNYAEIMGSTSRDCVVEMFFPTHRILSIKNLIFKSK
jgi:hypothetical protein